MTASRENWHSTDETDAYGPLAACGNCEKTKKSCTFDWLRSQRITQATHLSPKPTPLAKRRRTTSNIATPLRSINETIGQAEIKESDHRLEATGTESWIGSTRIGFSCGDLPKVPVQSADSTSPTAYQPTPAEWHGYEPRSSTNRRLGRSGDDYGADVTPVTYNSGVGSSLHFQPYRDERSLDNQVLSLDNDEERDSNKKAMIRNGAVIHKGRKRRRRSSSLSHSNGGLFCTATSFAADFMSLANQAVLKDGLLEIYHDSFENALSCWLTERTCPYSTKADVSLPNNGGPDWNRMYHRVFRLDRVASPIRGRQLTPSEDKKASKALNMTIFSFATQWAQLSERSKAKYPFDHGTNNRVSADHSASPSPTGIMFDRRLQIAAWNEARAALQDAGDIESFRLVLAQIIFSLTQEPHDSQSDHAMAEELDNRAGAMSRPIDATTEECEDLMARLNLAIDAEEAPVQLEKAVRLIHSLRSRLMMFSVAAPIKPANCRSRSHRPVIHGIDAADRATVDLLFWLGVMFDTLSSAMHKRPLVLSDEDSYVYADEAKTAADRLQRDISSAVSSGAESVWDIHLSAHQRSRLQQNIVRWPCSFQDAATLLCDAAPIKVLLFRKVTRIQTLVFRGCRGEGIERSIKAALSVCEHWERLYAPFIADCIEHHHTLPPQIISWYICLAGHWHLATLLLADIIEIVDDSNFGLEIQQMLRASTDFVACIRRSNCQALSDLARCSSPKEDNTPAQLRGFQSAVREGALLTEPWTAVLIRAFAKAAVVLLENEQMPSANGRTRAEEALRRADDCVQALWCLGRKSDVALLAANILGGALKQKRTSA